MTELIAVVCYRIENVDERCSLFAADILELGGKDVSIVHEGGLFFGLSIVKRQAHGAVVIGVNTIVCGAIPLHS